jgi:hypothetical protein
VLGSSLTEVTFGRVDHLVQMSSLETIERSAADARLGLNFHCQAAILVGDDPGVVRHAFDRPTVDELLQGEDMLALALEQPDDGASPLSVKQGRSLGAEGLFDVTRSGNRPRPVLKPNRRRVGRKTLAAFVEIDHRFLSRARPRRIARCRVSAAAWTR